MLLDLLRVADYLRPRAKEPFDCAPMSTASITTLVLEELGIELDLGSGDSRKREVLGIDPTRKWMRQLNWTSSPTQP